MASVVVAIGLVLLSCCACVVYLEHLSKADPGSMNLLTFAEFLFISIEGVILVTKFFTAKRFIPYRSYVKMVSLFFLVNVINNQALNYHIPVPLHIIFRSGSLLANMILGIFILHKRYSWQKYNSVMLITVGIIICTLASSNQKKLGNSCWIANAKTRFMETIFDRNPACGSEVVEASNHSPQFFEWIIGVSMLTFALFFSALLGIFQEQLYAKYGKHPREVMFYAHFLPLPFFGIFAQDIWNHMKIFNQSALYEIPFINLAIPMLWWYLIASVFTQYICIRSVYVLTSEFPSLTVTLVVTLRKFISLLISIWYFRNPFTLMHWAGTAMVFSGTLLFSEVHMQIFALTKKNTRKEK